MTSKSPSHRQQCEAAIAVLQNPDAQDAIKLHADYRQPEVVNYHEVHGGCLASALSGDQQHLYDVLSASGVRPPMVSFPYASIAFSITSPPFQEIFDTTLRKITA